jgi:hypothetical protein
VLKEEIIFTNRSNLDELNNNENASNNNSNVNNNKNDSCNFAKLEVDKQVYNDFKEELNNQFFGSMNFNNNNINYNKSRFLRSFENANLSKLNLSSILNNKENLNLSNQYLHLNHNANANNFNDNNEYNYNNNNNNYFQSLNSPKFNNKEGKEIKFDSTLNNFKDLKNIHESAVKNFFDLFRMKKFYEKLKESSIFIRVLKFNLRFYMGNTKKT